MKRIISMLLLTAMLLSLLPASAQAASSTNNSLFFDFTDDAAARNRYKATAYGNINYDVGGWNYDNERVSQILNDSGNGVLTMAVKKITRGEYYDKNGNYYSKSQVIDGYFQSSCSRSSCVWKRTKEHKYWLNKCGGPKNCTAGSMRNNPKGVSEGEVTCSKCDMDYCGLCGYEKMPGSSRHLTQVFKTPESALTTVTSPSPATKSVTVVDTISTTVIFYFLLFCRCFLREIRDFRNISDFEQTMPPHSPQYGVPQSAAWENCNRYKNTNDKLLFFILI